MKKVSILLTAVFMVLLLSSCGKNVTNKDVSNPEMTKIQESEGETNENTDVNVTTNASSKTIMAGVVYITSLNSGSEEASDAVRLNRGKARKAIDIINRNKFNSPSWDNINDYKIQIKDVDYYYDSTNGIITKDDTHAVKLSKEDKKTMNLICSESQTSASTASEETIEDIFIVKESNGTNLVMARYDMANGEYKEGLYACNYGNLYGSYAMHFNVGDIVSVRYDKELAETYPYQMNVKEIHKE